MQYRSPLEQGYSLICVHQHSSSSQATECYGDYLIYLGVSSCLQQATIHMLVQVHLKKVALLPASHMDD